MEKKSEEKREEKSNLKDLFASLVSLSTCVLLLSWGLSAAAVSVLSIMIDAHFSFDAQSVLISGFSYHTASRTGTANRPENPFLFLIPIPQSLSPHLSTTPSPASAQPGPAHNAARLRPRLEAAGYGGRVQSHADHITGGVRS